MRSVNGAEAVVFAALMLASCGSSSDTDGLSAVRVQNDEMESAIVSELDSQGLDRGDERDRDVVCGRPQPRHFICTAYLTLRDGIAARALYDVRVGDPRFVTNDSSVRPWSARALPGSTDALPATLSGELVGDTPH